ncbi:MAG: tetratricopeptide repeat protein [bacterium]|nr:tetratricopeptide repeat protein [bacterium]
MKLLNTLVMFLLIVTIAASAFGQVSKWQENYAMGIQLMKENKFPQAVKYLEEAANVAVSEIGKDNRDVATIYYNIGVIYNRMEIFSRAITNLSKAVEIMEKILTENDAELADFMVELADLYYDQGDYFSAIDLYEKLTGILEQNNKGYVDIAKFSKRIGEICMGLDDMEKSEVYYLKALTALEKEHGVEAQELIPFLKEIGEFYSMKGEQDNVIEYYSRILSIIEDDDFFEDIDVLLATHRDLGDLYKEAGRNDEAERHYKEAYNISRNEFGSSSDKTDNALDNYYQFRKSIGKSATRFEDLPRGSVALTAGYFNSAINDIEKDFIFRPKFEATFSIQVFRNYYLSYSAGTLKTYMDVRTYDRSDPLDRFNGFVNGANFKVNTHAIGLTFLVKEFLNFDQTSNWIGAGVTFLNSRRIETIQYQEYVTEGNNLYLDTKEDKVKTPFEATGFYMELGHRVTFPDFLRKNMAMGITIGTRYEFGKTKGLNVGGFTIFAGTNFLIF